ncbi:hypothetical protein DRJ48_02715 [Candidatus Woesearchaeota archaeon]|nr:hypothetical protein [Candidatus Woesearchaeota archaeon]RLE42795.1 MAG: hypothetical protein DRJ48_02715 [Candidatus Woesearchaeota archaeon]
MEPRFEPISVEELVERCYEQLAPKANQRLGFASPLEIKLVVRSSTLTPRVCYAQLVYNEALLFEFAGFPVAVLHGGGEGFNEVPNPIVADIIATPLINPNKGTLRAKLSSLLHTLNPYSYFSHYNVLYATRDGRVHIPRGYIMSEELKSLIRCRIEGLLVKTPIYDLSGGTPFAEYNLVAKQKALYSPNPKLIARVASDIIFGLQQQMEYLAANYKHHAPDIAPRE